MPQSYEYWEEPENLFAPRKMDQSSNFAYQQQPASSPSNFSYQQSQSQAFAQPHYASAPAAVAYVPMETKKSRGWIVALVAVVCLFVLSLFFMKSCTDLLGSSSPYAGYATSEPGSDSIAVMELSGTIQYDGTACSPEGFKALLDEAADDTRIKALVLRVNSGGGTATAGEEMAEYLREFDKPVVVSSASINASAAYEISSQADYIYVANSTEIGAIGTAMEVTDLSGLLDMIGVDVDVITSADSKDSTYGYRSLTDDERSYYQHMIDQINNVFIQNVAYGRNMTDEEVRSLATGLAFTGIDAVENGLADEVGTLEDAVDMAAQLAGLENYSVYELGFSSYDLGSLYDLLGSAGEGGQSSMPLMKQ